MREAIFGASESGTRGSRKVVEGVAKLQRKKIVVSCDTQLGAELGALPIDGRGWKSDASPLPGWIGGTGVVRCRTYRRHQVGCGKFIRVRISLLWMRRRWRCMSG